MRRENEWRWVDIGTRRDERGLCEMKRRERKERGDKEGDM